MESITVRQATLDDAAALAGMLDRFDGLGATPAQVAARMRALRAAMVLPIDQSRSLPACCPARAC